MLFVLKSKNAFLSLDDDKKGIEAIQLSGYDGFAESSDEMYDIVRKYLEDYITAH